MRHHNINLGLIAVTHVIDKLNFGFDKFFIAAGDIEEDFDGLFFQIIFRDIYILTGLDTGSSKYENDEKQKPLSG